MLFRSLKNVHWFFLNLIFNESIAAIEESTELNRYFSLRRGCSVEFFVFFNFYIFHFREMNL